MVSSKKHPLVSIVILNWNGLEDTKICLKHVRELSYPNYEIIIVDNGSSAREKNYLKGLKDIVFVDNPRNRGFAGGQADGYKVAGGEFILLLNNDAVIKHDYLEKALPYFDDPTVAVVGGRSYFWNKDEPLLDTSNRFYAYMQVNPFSAETTLMMSDDGVVQEVNTVSGSSVVVRRAAIDVTGYLYEPFFAYYEETDLFARMKRAGFRVLYNPELQIWHKNGASSGAQGGSSFFYYHIFRNRFMYALRNFEQPYLRKFLRNYYVTWLKSLPKILVDTNRKRLGVAYTKAVLTTLLRLPVILSERKNLSEQLSSSYCAQLIQEQVKISIVVDARVASPSVLRQTLGKIRNKNAAYEYVFLVKSIPKDSEQTPFVRFVADSGYFSTHPVNIACIAARMPWLIITDIFNIPNTATLREATTTIVRDNKKLIYKSSYIVVSKDYYQKMGGMCWDQKTLAQNFLASGHYAKIDNALASHSDKLADYDTSDIIDKLSIDTALILPGSGSRFDLFLSRHYRLFQAASLLRWLLMPTIPLRLKLGRIKNILLFTLTLRRKLLATELRHTRNELRIYGTDHPDSKTKGNTSQPTKETGYSEGKRPEEIPIYIICFERVDALKKLVAWLEKIGMKKIVFLDNDSSYKPLLDYYKKTPYQVLPLLRNIGHTAPWSLGITRILTPDEYYVVTDPDVIPVDDCPEDVIKHFLDIHMRHLGYQKVGFGLKIDDLPDFYPLKKSVVKWEKQFWQTALEPDVYDAPLDTTFALYKPATYHYFLAPSIRTGGKYTARHLPWYVNPQQTSDEEEYYRLRANSSITSWNVDELPERYEKEMKNDE